MTTNTQQPTIICDPDKGCTPVQLATQHQAEQDRRIGENESAVRSVHRRIDALQILMITTLASSLAGAVLAYLAYIGSHAGK